MDELRVRGEEAPKARVKKARSGEEGYGRGYKQERQRPGALTRAAKTEARARQGGGAAGIGEATPEDAGGGGVGGGGEDDVDMGRYDWAGVGGSGGGGRDEEELVLAEDDEEMEREVLYPGGYYGGMETAPPEMGRDAFGDG